MRTYEQTLHIEDDIPPFPVTYMETDDSISDVLQGLRMQDEAVARTLWLSEQLIDQQQAETWDAVLEHADGAIDAQLEAQPTPFSTEVGQLLLAQEAQLAGPAIEQAGSLALANSEVYITLPSTQMLGELALEAASQEAVYAAESA